MRHKTTWFLSSLFVLGMASLVRADDPTSRFFPLSRLASSLSPSSTGNVVQFEVWDSAAGGTMIVAEPHNVDTDAGSNITNDTGLTDLLLGRGTAGGLAPVNFPAGSTRYLDVSQGGTTVLTARVPLYASVFSVSAPNEVPGNLAMVNSTATAGNILKDGALFLHNFGNNSTFLGSNAGNVSMTGFGGNTGVGANALRNNTDGSANTAVGVSALNNNTTGYWNTATGANALFSNTTGFQNTAVGTSALVNNTTGIVNTAVGFEALKSNTSGGVNTAIGESALKSNTTGEGNTATGNDALYSNTSGILNTATGESALDSNTTGRENTASGSQALFWNTTGSDNSATGRSALANNRTGSANTAVGREALHDNTEGNNNTAVGDQALRLNIRGNNNTAIGASSGVNADDLTNATAIGAGAIVDASNKIRLGNTSVSVIEGQVAYTFTSDKNQKENFQSVNAEDVLTKLAHLPVSTWNYIGHDPKQFRHYGPVAQDFFAAFGHDGVGMIGTDTTINSGDMEGILMIAVQALERRTSELATLKAENADLKSRLEKLERSTASFVAKAE